MSYRIRYEKQKKPVWKWTAAGVCAGSALWFAVSLGPVWSRVAAGEGLYDALARFVGGLILAAG